MLFSPIFFLIYLFIGECSLLTIYVIRISWKNIYCSTLIRISIMLGKNLYPPLTLALPFVM